MAKIVLLVGLFAFAAFQISQAAPKPDDVTVEPSKPPAETQPPVTAAKSAEETTVTPNATLSSAELYYATMAMDLFWDPENYHNDTSFLEISTNTWWEYVPRKSVFMRNKSAVSTPSSEMPGSDTSPSGWPVPTTAVQVKAEVVEVAAATTEVAAEVKA